MYFSSDLITILYIYGVFMDKEYDIDFMDLKIPVPQGSVEVSFKRVGGKKIYSVKAPKTLHIIFEGEDFELIRNE